MNIFNTISIKRKLFILITAVFLLSILIAATYAGISFLKSSKDISNKTAELINDNYVEKINASLQKAINLTKFLSKSLSIENETYAISSEQKTKLIEFIKDDSYVIDLFLILGNDIKSIEKLTDKSQSANQLSLHKINNEVISQPFDERNYKIDFLLTANLKQGQSAYISDPFMLKFIENEIIVITITVPVNVNQKQVGFVGINYSLKEISEIINTPAYYSKNSSSILLSQNNEIIFVSDKHWLSGKNIIRFQGSEHEIYNKIKSNNNKFIGFNDITGAYRIFKIEQSNVNWELITTISHNVIIKKLIDNIYLAIFLASVIMLLGLFIVIFYIQKAFTPFDKIIELTDKISLGDTIKMNNFKNNNEFGKIVTNINKISENLKNASEISSKIASGDFDHSLTPNSEIDTLSLSINKIAENLKKSIEEADLQEKKTHQQLWMRRGRFEVSEAERISSNEINDLSYNIIRVLVNFTDAILGGMYLYDNEQSTISLVSAYAYGNKKLLEKEFKVGEGLVGACVVEGKKILLTKVPEDYIRVASGLGSGTPGFLAIIPVFFQEKINSLIEIAFLKKPEDYIIEFIEQLCDNIGAWIDASLIHTKTSKLLSISIDQTKELAEKEEELYKKVNELQMIQDQIAVQNAEYESMLSAVNHSVMTVEYTNDGIVINANEIYTQTMGYKLSDIRGNSVFDLVKDQKENLVEIIENVKKGLIIKRQVKRYTKEGQEKSLSATYTPFYSKEGSVERILFFAFDVTDLIK